ncbi:MAG: flagellar biosynthesis protein FlhB [bacterium]
MPPGGEKTEKPTPRRKQEARDEGQVAKSQELNTAFTLGTSFLILYLLFGNIFESLKEKMTTFLTLYEVPDFTINSSVNLLMETFLYIVILIAPILIATAIAGVAICILQVRPMFNLKLIRPKFSKLDPIKGAKNLVSMKSIIELLKSIAKASIITYLTYSQLKNNYHFLINSMEQGIESALLFIGYLIFKIVINIIIFLIILGVADYLYQRWEFMKNLRMSKQEIKDEHKKYEGDPLIKAQRKHRQRQITMNRMMSAMEEADVIITNPTHIAIAIKFDMETMEAPVVVAKGEDFIAQKLKEKARELNIEIVENKPLARALNKSTEIGDEIPIEFYQAVAEVLSFVYRKK